MPKKLLVSLLVAACVAAGCNRRLLREVQIPSLTVATKSTAGNATARCLVLTEVGVGEIPAHRLNYLEITMKLMAQRILQEGAAVNRLDIKLEEPCIGTASPMLPKGYLVTIDHDQLTAATEVEFLSTMAHEYAHVLYFASEDIQAKMKEFFACLYWHEKDYFRDRNFIGPVGNNRGHPWDNENELFASAFMLASLLRNGFLAGPINPPPGNAAEFWTWVQSLEPFNLFELYQKAPW